MASPQVLSVVWYKVLPARFGGQKGIAEFNAHLSEHIPLRCLCSSDNDPACASYPVENSLPVGKWQVMSPVHWWKILAAVRSSGSTHLMVEHCYYALAGMLTRRRLGIPWILHEHNIEYLRFREMNRWWWPLLKWLESMACRKASLVLFKTEKDRQHAILHFGMDQKRSMIVPFGLSPEARPSSAQRSQAANEVRSLHGIPEDTRILFFSGTLDYEPNAQAFRRIVQDIIPRLDIIWRVPFVVIICGRLQHPAFQDLKALHHARLKFVGEVEDIRPYFLAADLFMNPVDSGGGIKVKTMEALAYDLPVVSTEHSASGIDPSLTGGKLRICPDGDITAFCQAIMEAIDDRSPIPEAYFLHYQWRHLTLQVADAIKKLTN